MTSLVGDHATSRGDVGALIRVWERWAISSQGTSHLRNYRHYIPHLLLTIKHNVPPLLRAAIIKGLLLYPSGRPNHFLPKDLFLEVLNYELTFFLVVKVSFYFKHVISLYLFQVAVCSASGSAYWMGLPGQSHLDKHSHGQHTCFPSVSRIFSFVPELFSFS